VDTHWRSKRDPVIEESLKREASLTDPEEIEDERLFRHLHSIGAFNQVGERISIEELERMDAETKMQDR
jgi:hypothetical protein